MKVIKAPNRIFPLKGDRKKLLFLAGSIEMGKAENWQQKVERLLDGSDWTILNPRRDDWDSSWEQKKENDKFREQVEWELLGLEQASRILMYFDPSTMSPISLLELGLFGMLDHNKLIVVCPEGFWRKGNVDIVCERYGISQTSTIEEAVNLLN